MKTTMNSIKSLGIIFSILFALCTVQAQQPDNNLIASLEVAPKNQFKNVASTKLNSSILEEATKYQYDASVGQSLARFEGLDAYIEKHLVYPEIAKENTIEGTVMILTTISASGEVIETELIKSLGDIIDQTALEVVKQMPAWTPAMNYGIPVKSKRIVELRYSMR